MKYVRSLNDHHELGDYVAYIKARSSDFPSGVRDFILPGWHYDISDHQCPHDSWLESVSVEELRDGSRRESRGIEIVAKFLGAYHDILFELRYIGVHSYSISLISDGKINRDGHGDWIVDEVTIDDYGFISHEILFSSPGSWIVSCDDIKYSWRRVVV